MTNRCNLRCKHCYIEAEDKSYREELSTEEAREFIKDLADMKAPVLLFSGGEPLMRKDIFELGKMAAELGLRPVISSNGTLIDRATAAQIKAAGFQYVGISIDGAPATHDEFRNKQGAFAAALKGIKACLAEGVKPESDLRSINITRPTFRRFSRSSNGKGFPAFACTTWSMPAGAKKWPGWIPIRMKNVKSWS
jgi:Predicted Fe-S oxidoreductases